MDSSCGPTQTFSILEPSTVVRFSTRVQAHLYLGTFPPLSCRLRILVSHERVSSRNTFPVEGSFQFTRNCSGGAILAFNTPLTKEMIDHYRSDFVTDYVRKHLRSWYIFANRKLRRGINFEQLIFVTHCYKTSSWSAAVLSSTVSRGFELSFSGGVIAAASVGLSTSFKKEVHREAPLCRTGPPVPSDDEQLPNDQTAFVQGWGGSRWLRTLPLRPRSWPPLICRAEVSISRHELDSSVEACFSPFFGCISRVIDTLRLCLDRAEFIAIPARLYTTR